MRLFLLFVLLFSPGLARSQQLANVVHDEETTTYPGGMPAFYRFVSENLKYPKEAKREGVAGRVLVEFTVDSNGGILPGSVRVLKRLHPACDEEASRLIQRSSPWVPGTRNGEPVPQRMAVTIAFGLAGQ